MYFPFSETVSWVTWDPVCKKFGVGLLVVTIWLELCKFARLMATAVTTTSINQ